MDAYCKAILEMSRLCITRRLTANGPVSAKPCYVFFVNACPDNGENLYECALHNGETAAAEVLIDIESRYGQNKCNPCIPTYFNKGIYYAHTTNMKSLTIQYYEEARQ